MAWLLLTCTPACTVFGRGTEDHRPRARYQRTIIKNHNVPQQNHDPKPETTHKVSSLKTHTVPAKYEKTRPTIEFTGKIPKLDLGAVVSAQFNAEQPTIDERVPSKVAPRHLPMQSQLRPKKWKRGTSHRHPPPDPLLFASPLATWIRDLTEEGIEPHEVSGRAGRTHIGT